MEEKDNKKQKAGLNAVRPDDFVEQRFKEMAKEKNLSQTEMFERLFWSYLKESRETSRNEALNCESEINLISKDLSNIVDLIKGIASKAQDKIISITANSEQTIKNLELDKETQDKKLEELAKRNAELEKINALFDEIKQGLEKTIIDQKEVIQKKDAEYNTLKEMNVELEKTVKAQALQIRQNETQLMKHENAYKRHVEEIENNITKLRSLEITNSSLQSTINNMENIKKSEISAIESKYKSVVTDMENKLKFTESNIETQISNITNNLKSEYEAEKKLAIAEIKLELADYKSKYADAKTEVNNLTQELQQNQKRTK